MFAKTLGVLCCIPRKEEKGRKIMYMEKDGDKLNRDMNKCWKFLKALKEQ